MITNYYKTKLVKMGKWALLPADVDNWYTEDTSRYTRKIFGFGKGLLVIYTFADGGWEHTYAPIGYIKKIHDFIRTITVEDYKALEKKLLKFYPLKKKLKQKLLKPTLDEIRKSSNGELIKFYRQNRDWAHQAAVFDQFNWLAEDYWNPLMKDILIKKLKLSPDSAEYHQALFALAKPREISTTLEEKRAVLKKAWEIKNKKITLDKASKYLAKTYGWMSVSVFGEPWGADHYLKELSELAKRPLFKLKEEYHRLEKYTELRDLAIIKLVARYNISKQDLQVFIDFSLATDGRNEAEYLLSFCGFYLLPLYKEIARRLALSVNQLRLLYEDEIVAALAGKLDYQETIAKRKRVAGHGYDEAMAKRYYFTPQEAAKMFEYLEKNVQYVQGADEYRGVCASPGQAQGRVKVVISPKDNHKVKKGDIMIAIATMVDHLPAMKNAAAIITEVGGLTCHAAVVSREFGVPCIVALKNATKNFKDGEMVEVDADKGVIRKI